MSDTLASLRRKSAGAHKLKAVVRTMKAIAASSISQYETAVLALADYERTVALGLRACLHHADPTLFAMGTTQHMPKRVGAIIFGSDQGLVGQFNDVMAAFAETTLKALPGSKEIWVVGERLHAKLSDGALPIRAQYALPASVANITQLIGQIQLDSESYYLPRDGAHLYLFHNQPLPGGAYQPVCQRLLPLDAQWQKQRAQAPWPSKRLPETLGSTRKTLSALLREYLFVSLYKACAESLSSENASRLAAMQRAEKNIDTLSSQLQRSYYQLRQNAIDEELFDVLAGFNALGA